MPLPLLLAAALASALAGTAGAQAAAPAPGWTPLPLVHELLRAYTRERGRPPVRLDELCTVVPGGAQGCPRGFAEQYFRDPWGRAPLVVPARGDTAYVLRSSGADGAMGTADDLFVPDEAAAWRPLLRAAAGCYAWLPGAGRALGALADDVPRFQLDTLAGRVGPALGSYEMRPRWTPDSASAGEQLAVWRLRAPDTLFLSWGTTLGGTDVRLVMRQGEVLQGDAALFSAGASRARQAAPAPRRPVAAERVACPDRMPNASHSGGGDDRE